MKQHIWAKASTWDKDGWVYTYTLPGHDSWEKEQPDYVFLGEVDFPEPKISQLVQIGVAKVEALEKERVEENAVAIARIKEYESKFLMLENTEEED